MTDQKYIVHCADFTQSIQASEFAVKDEHLFFINAAGDVAGYFNLGIVEKWYSEAEPSLVHTPKSTGKCCSLEEKMTPVRYKVFFHHGNEIGLKTKVCKGEAWIDSAGLNIKGPKDTTVIAKEDLRKVETIHLHGSLSVLQIEHNGGRLFLCVVRFMIGQFAMGNFFANKKLQKALSDLLKPS